MGGATSKNLVDVTMKAIANVTVNIFSKQDIGTYGTQSILVEYTKGDVNISGIDMKMKINVNMDDMFKALSTTDVQQQVKSEVQQQAKALIEGINTLNFSNAQNELKEYMEEVTNITKNFKNICKGVTSSTQSIVVSHTGGSVTISDVTMSSVQDLISKCYADVLANTKSAQNLQTTIDQSASATTKGISMWAIITLVVIVVVGLSASAIAGKLVKGTDAGSAEEKKRKWIFFLMFSIVGLTGIGGIVGFFYWRPKIMKLYGYSPGIVHDDACEGQRLSSSTKYTSGVSAGNDCMDNKDCVAYDWINYTIGSNGTATKLTTPQTYMYKKVRKVPCPSEANPDKSTTVSHPNTSGYKEKQIHWWLLYLSIAVLVVGLFGSFVMMLMTGGKAAVKAGGQVANVVAENPELLAL